jgi:hypothetical protein
MIMNIPEFDEALGLLRTIARSDEIAADDALNATDVDSLDLLEWVADIGIDTETLTDERELMERLAEMTIREIYEALTDGVASGTLVAKV